MKDSKEIIKYKNLKGITLIPLVITVAVILIIVGVVISNGLSSADNVKLQNFYKELQIIQKRVDVIYEEAKLDTNKYVKYNSVTKEFTAKDESGNDKVPATDTINGVTDNAGYYMYTPAQLETLGIEGITQSVYINWSKRDVVSVDGIEVNGITSYRDPSTNKPTYTENDKEDISITKDNNIRVTGTSVKKVEVIRSKY